ncbi:MAG: type II toxin-antitoxin system VapC family toxin [Acaryochloris sp. RU_4_1]|nr:type II toxin-antitoxin system VapC family toxin [Leptolyngbyaceae cyanobacterium SU_3_3]NJM66675.1 type II toxin-antitoxin system VapC family toxin [Acaryochloris sp. RU_4_1]NJR56538.1 type II toxin-antitoxin system VapC family toxin [Acaryochloris sp. CRU_2_0]
MTLRYLLDTNIVSEPLRISPNSQVLYRLQRDGDKIAIATVVWHELWFGCYRLPSLKKCQAIEQYLLDVIQPTIPILGYTADAAKWHANQRARLAALGKMPPFADGQIAAIAQTNHLILVTGNVSDYQNFTELQIENWYDNNQ